MILKRANYLFALVAFLALLQESNETAFGAHCQLDEFCHQHFNSHYQCIDNKCRREDLFPLTTKEIFGLFLLTTISAVANAGGLGGGAVIVPVYIFVFDYVTKESVPLSKATILAGALMNIFLIARKRHPHNPAEYLVDYGLAGAMIPLLLAGTMIGVMLANMLPPIFVVVLLSAYLYKSTNKMKLKAISFYKKETEENKRRKAKLENDVEKQGLLDGEDLDSKSQNSDGKSLATETETETDLASSTGRGENDGNGDVENGGGAEKGPLQIEPRTKVEPTTLFSIFLDLSFQILAFFAILIVALLRGGHGVSSIIGIDTCSKHSWGLLILAQIICYLCSLVNQMRNSEKLIGRAGSPKFDQNKKRLNHLLIASYISGIGAGLLGIGGGMIMNPVMLDLGFIPEVSAAVAGFSVLFTSSSTTSQFVVAGAINLKQAAWYLGFSSLGSLIGNIIIFRIIRKYNRPSLLVWILYGLLLSSVFVLPTMGIYKIY